jgi:hypothetical protein
MTILIKEARAKSGLWSDHPINKCVGLKLQAKIVTLTDRYNYVRKLYLTNGDKRYPFSTSFYFYDSEVEELTLMDKLDKLFEDDSET